jgi:hypothetical protein
MPLVAIVFGWPAVIASVLITAGGLALSRWRIVLIGACVGTPFLFYLALTPRFGVIAPLVGVAYFAAVRAVARGHRMAGVTLVTPFAVLAAFVAALVLQQ